ncbi:hypothetical protein D6D10_09021 [Aureobasidium pullulans]|uniref:Rhodopsin domain-containing protein n=1 Tax=Aureobasidium pullulans TaxID=5580 RepID=A0A4S9E6I7_AURPU|nr:hypothetical protein D6D10_09021 [Aureobasidium pullulans]
MESGGLSDRAKGYIYGNDLLMGFAFVVVATRFYCRMRMGSKRGLWWDDLFIMLSFIFAVGFGATVNVAMGHYGWDRHIWTIPAAVLSTSVKAYTATKILFVLSGTCVRMALLLFYLWLIKDLAERRLRQIIYAVMALNFALCLAGVLVSIFQCWPIRAAWTWEIKDDARCLNESVSITTIGALLSVLDFIVNILPLPIVARLNVAFKQRIAATVLLSLGTIATAAGVVREVYVYRAFIGTKDSTWGALPLWICADVEIYVGLLCACVPSLRPLWPKVRSWFSSCKACVHSNDSSRHSAGDLHVPATMSWHDFDKDVIFDGTSSFHSASHLWGSRKKSYTTTIATRLEKPVSQSDSFCLTSNNREWEEVALRDLEANYPKEVHVRTSVRLQNHTI